MYYSLYIHVPFCHGGKCDYCAFYSLGHSTPELRAQYLTRLEEEFAEHAPECAPLRSVFIGGGTPSALSAEELSRLLAAVRALPGPQRDVFLLRAAGVAFADIAARFRIPLNTALGRMHYAMKALRSALDPNGDHKT